MEFNLRSTTFSIRVYAAFILSYARCHFAPAFSVSASETEKKKWQSGCALALTRVSPSHLSKIERKKRNKEEERDEKKNN